MTIKYQYLGNNNSNIDFSKNNLKVDSFFDDCNLYT